MVLRPAAEVAVIGHAFQTSFNTLSGREAHQNTGGAAPPNVNKDVALSSMALNQEEVVEDQVEADMKIPFRESCEQRAYNHGFHQVCPQRAALTKVTSFLGQLTSND